MQIMSKKQTPTSYQEEIVQNPTGVIKLDPLVVKNSLNASHFPKFREMNHLPSMTIPDQSLKIKEILIRYARGLPMHTSAQTPVYNGEGYLPDFKTMDISEIADMREFMKQKISSARERLYAEAAAIEEAKHKEYMDWKENQSRIKETKSIIDEVNNKSPNP